MYLDYLKIRKPNSKFYILLFSDYSMVRNEQYFIRLEKEKIKAAGDWDGVKYVQICNELGIIPGILELSELGQAELRFNSIQRGLEKSVVEKSQKKGIKRKRSVPNKRYENFYDEGGRLNLNIGACSDEKNELLIKYFPGRFGDKGRQPVCNMDYLSVGALFNKLVKYAESRINQ